MFEWGRPLSIEAQCGEHAGYGSVEALAGELMHFHGNAHRLDTCDCKRAYWYDDREDRPEHGGHPVEHPEHTVRCEHHAHLTSAQAHADAVTAEYQLRSRAVVAVAEALGWRPAPVGEPLVPAKPGLRAWAGHKIRKVLGARPVLDHDPLALDTNPQFAPARIPWSFNADRKLVIDATALGVSPEIVRQAVEAATKRDA